MLLLADPTKKRTVSSLFSDGDSTFPSPSSGEVIPLEVAIVDRIPNPRTTRLWLPKDLENWTIRAAIGKGFVLPAGGSFTLTFGANTTAALAFSASASDVETALNLLASVIAAGGVTVTGSNGYFVITFVDEGARTQITIDETNLAPVSIGEEATLLQGSGSIAEVQSIRFFQNPGAYAALTVEGDESEITSPLEEVDAGGPGVNHKVRIEIDPAPYDGKISVTISGVESEPIAWDASEETLTAALEGMTISAGALVSGQKYTILSYLDGPSQTSGALVSGGIYRIDTYEEEGTILTSGALVSGKKYKIVAFVAGDDFANLGASNTTGAIFDATGTTPTVWTEGSQLTLIDDFLNLGAGTNEAGVVFTSSGTTADSYVNGSVLVRLDNFANVGATNEEGNVFTASGTTPSYWGGMSVLTPVGEGNVSVFEESPGHYLLTFIGDLAATDMNAITAIGIGLKAIPTLGGELDMRTSGISLLLGANESAQAIFEIEATPPDGEPQKLVRQQVTAVAGIITTGAVSVPPSGSTTYLTDDTDGETYKLVSNNGILGLELVS